MCRGCQKPKVTVRQPSTPTKNKPAPPSKPTPREKIMGIKREPR